MSKKRETGKQKVAARDDELRKVLIDAGLIEKWFIRFAPGFPLLTPGSLMAKFSRAQYAELYDMVMKLAQYLGVEFKKEPEQPAKIVVRPQAKSFWRSRGRG